MRNNPKDPSSIRNCMRQTNGNRPFHVESLEQRLLLSWGGVPPAKIAVPPSSTSVALNNQDDAQGSAWITRNEVDFYSLIAPHTGSYRFAAETPSSNLDSVLAVFDATGRRVAYNDDSLPGVQTDSDLSVTLQAGSRYFFGITNYIGSGGGSYVWLVNGPESSLADDSYEENDSLLQAADLGTPSSPRTVSGLVMADSQDWFRFQMNDTGSSPKSVSIQFQHSFGDLDLRVYDSAGRLLQVSDGETDSERISLAGLAAGTYFVQVYGYRNATNPSYTLTIDPGTVSSPTPPAGTGGFHIALAFHGLTTSQQTIFNQAAARWEQVITGDLPDARYNGTTVDDLLIDASGAAIDGTNGILGQAGPDRFRSGSVLPYHGTMEFDTADLARMESNGTLRDVILHEMGHVLGIGTIWTNLGLLTGAGSSTPCFIGATAVAEYNATFGRSASCVPVENSGGPGTRDAHWRESIFGTELMTGYISAAGTPNPLSRITVGSLRDLGYSVDLNWADPFVRPGTSVVTTGQASQSSQTQLRRPIKQSVWYQAITTKQDNMHRQNSTAKNTNDLVDSAPLPRLRRPDGTTTQPSNITWRDRDDTPIAHPSVDAIDELLTGIESQVLRPSI